MNRWLAIGVIVTYLGTLLSGVASHALNYRSASHPGMYFIVWDMFCGWSAYESRLHIIGEGESGRFYELGPGPWGELNPFGDLGRHHYDPFATHSAAIAVNTLRHSSHEPMRQVYVVEESWAKKYNLPQKLWDQQYPEARDPFSYYHLRKVLTPEGDLVSESQPWSEYQAQVSLSDNPRLWKDSQRDQPFYQVRPSQRSTVSDDISPQAFMPRNLVVER